MTGRVRKTASGGDPGPKLDLQRIRVNGNGYDATGAYWGAGPDVFIATREGGSQEITVRAKSVADAREKVAAELARQPSDVSTGPREPVGGASPNKRRYAIDWCDPVGGSTIRIRVTHSRDYLASGSDHIEVEAVQPKKAALPITETGYRSQFLSALELINKGGPVTYVTSWLDREAKSRDWQKRQTARSQGDLFQWADANVEVGARRRSPKPKVPRARPAKARNRDRDPA